MGTLRYWEDLHSVARPWGLRWGVVARVWGTITSTLSPHQLVFLLSRSYCGYMMLSRYCHHLLWPPFCLVNSDFGWIIMICIFYRQACAKCSHAGIVFTQWSKNGFYATQERHVAPINVKFGTRERTAPCQIWGLSGGNVGMQPQNYQHFEFWP